MTSWQKLEVPDTVLPHTPGPCPDPLIFLLIITVLTNPLVR